MRPRIITARSSTSSAKPAVRKACSPRSARARLIERPPMKPARRGSGRFLEQFHRKTAFGQQLGEQGADQSAADKSDGLPSHAAVRVE